MKLKDLLASDEHISFFKELELPVHTHVLYDAVLTSALFPNEDVEIWSAEFDPVVPDPFDRDIRPTFSISLPVHDGTHELGYLVILTRLTQQYRIVGLGFGSGPQGAPIQWYYTPRTTHSVNT
jgi:hypothetical protein